MMIFVILAMVMAVYAVVKVIIKSAALSRESKRLNQEIDRLLRSH